jgi:hypothetical protein
MPRAGFESAIPATIRPQTYALDRAATGISIPSHYISLFIRGLFNDVFSVARTIKGR